MELHFTGTGAAYYPRLGSNAAFFVKNNHLYYNKHGTGYGSQPYSIPTRT